MNSQSPSTRLNFACLLILMLGATLSLPATLFSPATAQTPGPDVSSPPGSQQQSNIAPTAEATVSPTLLPPYEVDTFQQQQPDRTRLDRIISAAAPIAMVLVLVAGLYIYWLIRKGL